MLLSPDQLVRSVFQKIAEEAASSTQQPPPSYEPPPENLYGILAQKQQPVDVEYNPSDQESLDGAIQNRKRQILRAARDTQYNRSNT